ncbi:MAG: ABC transporter permease [Chloroflexota bacterium]|nr:ABC transporter permease [Chloroflexota bacterium]
MSTSVTQPAQAKRQIETTARHETPLGIFLRRFRKNKLAIVGAFILTTMIVLAVFAPLIAPYDPLYQDLERVLESESVAHPMGTDDLGRDVLSRIIYGAQLSLLAAIYAVGVAFLIGVPVGLFSGYYRGFWDEWVVMRIVDAMQAFPFLILALALAATLGAGFGNAMIAIGIGFSPAFVRIVRAQVMTVANQEYIQAARAVGVRDLRILLRHILPNSMAPLLVQTTLAMASAILAEAGLSFLGLGAQPPRPSWGQMLSGAQGYISLAPWLAYWPGIAIFFAVLGFNLVGDGVREALDPKLRH